jgi:hypothetical protein
MKLSILKNIGALGLAAVFCFGCSPADSVKNQTPETSRTSDTASGKTSETTISSASPCANKFYPVVNGLKRNYNNTIGGKTTGTMEYKDGDANFTEVTSLKDTTVKHAWLCTDEGLTAANYGSAAEMKNMQVEPKHISGVTLPREDEIKVGKMWTTVYKATGTSPMGAIDMTVTINNKIVSLDDAVKTPAGTFNAVKIEMDIDADMKFGGKKMPVPVIKSAAWFAPDVGMVKSTGGIGGMSNTMEYTGSN